MADHRPSFATVTGLLLALLAGGCGAAPEEPTAAVGSVAQAEDNAPSAPNGTACYVDGPHVDKSDWYTKGSMTNGNCCFTKNCYSCTDYYECQVGGAKPAAATVADPTTTSGAGQMATQEQITPPPPPPPPPPSPPPPPVYRSGPPVYEP